MKEKQLKSMKGDISKISSLMTYIFLLVKIHREEKFSLRRFMIGNVYIYSPFGGHIIVFLNSLEICDALQLDLKNRL